MNIKFTKMIEKIQFATDDIYKFEEKVTKNDWVSAGVDDDFFTFLYDLVDFSPIHNVCLRSKTDNVVGQGFTNDYQMNRTEDINDLFRKIAYEYIVTGNVFLECVWANDRSKGLKSVYFIPSDKIRVGKTDYYSDDTESFYYCEDWTKWRKVGVVEMKGLDPNDYTNRQIYHIKNYAPGYRYYGLPNYMSVVNDVRLNHEISVHHLANIRNGMTPSLWVNFRNGAPTSEKDQRDIKNKLLSTYQGSENAGNIIVSFSDTDNGPEITSLNPTSNDAYYSTIFESVQRQILSGHKITDPSLIGLPTPSGFSSQADQIETSFLLFLNTTIKPLQQELISGMYPVVEMMYPDQEVTLEIIQNNIL